MSTTTKQILEQVGSTLPERQRVKRTQSQSVKLVPTGEIRVNVTMDTFVVQDNDDSTKKKNALEGKNVVLLFGRESHPLCRNFLTPKMACMYHHLTLARPNDVEFLYVSLPEETQPEFDRFTKSHPWPCIPWKEQEVRQTLTSRYHAPLKKNGASVVVLEADHETVLNRDAEPNITRTHNETGDEFPWKTSGAENCCAAGAACLMCHIM